MDKKMGTLQEEPDEPSDSQPHDDDELQSTGKEQRQGESKASSQGKEGLNNEEACQSIAEETFTEVGKRMLNIPASA